MEASSRLWETNGLQVSTVKKKAKPSMVRNVHCTHTLNSLELLSSIGLMMHTKCCRQSHLKLTRHCSHYVPRSRVFCRRTALLQALMSVKFCSRSWCFRSAVTGPLFDKIFMLAFSISDASVREQHYSSPNAILSRRPLFPGGSRQMFLGRNHHRGTAAGRAVAPHFSGDG